MNTRVRTKFALALLLAATPLFALAQSAPVSLGYVLQADVLAGSKQDAVAKLAESGRDWIVIDAFFTGDERWAPADLAAIRKGKAGRKVIAYLSIGEAEDYRPYWRKEWDAAHSGKPSAAAPPFLLAQNPEWKGNYRVKYWQPTWQAIILAEVDRIMAAGFDGVYLDIVDGFETFERNGSGDDYEDNKIDPETKQSYRRDMVDFVKQIALRARKANPAALLIPQNGAQLLAHKDFLKIVDAIGIEDLFADGDKPRKPGDVRDVLDDLAPMIAARKPVFDVEYPRKPELQSRVKEQATSHGFVWLVTGRELKTLGESGK
ncbi:MAG TPA: MJ1477/TM1410 family putative glycoside hydrolase [Chthoniobacteraceae bacterium]|nr:MJ1477/TM1410 family putative glycoside hydrolase [Chthoniobacteraceae bacterium]